MAERPQRNKPSLTLRRQLAASPDQVFQAWTRPEALKAWFGPGEIVEVPVAEVDLRVGGRYRIVMRAQDGELHRVGGVYREIVPGRRLRFSWAWESTPERVSQVTVELTAKDGGTLLTLTHEQFFDEAARDRHRYGWTGSLDKLVGLFKGHA
ncbi:MAG TPA: SRPBCC domain-containing protein [Hyphomicrobiaceae bacterium]|nr:SRPBCC domain-containing protein [Hyphomicrobiaceae bacterium]